MHKESARTEFLAEIPSDFESTRKEVLFNACCFPWDYLSTNPQRKIDQKLGSLFQELQGGRFWGALTMIDGNYNEFQPDSPEERTEARKWAKENFTNQELQRILDICVKTALSVPKETPWPGTYKGHSILYRELVEKPDSIFKESVTEKFRKRLINGRFWEEIPDMKGFLNGGISYKKVNDILVNHFAELDIDFTPQGYKIFQRNYGEKENNFDIDGLSDEGINSYAKFLEEINMNRSNLGLSTEQISYLVKTYATVIISNRKEGEKTPRFKFEEKLKEPLVVEYLTNSDLVRTAVAKEFELEAIYGDWRYALSILSCIPNPQEIFDKMVDKMVSPKYDLERLCQKASPALLEPYLGPRSKEILQKKA